MIMLFDLKMLSSFNISVFEFLLLLTLYSALAQANLNASDIGDKPFLAVNNTLLVIYAEHNIRNSSDQLSDASWTTKEETKYRESTTSLTPTTSAGSDENYDRVTHPPFQYKAAYSSLFFSTTTLSTWTETTSLVWHWQPRPTSGFRPVRPVMQTGYELPLGLLTDADWQADSSTLLSIPSLLWGCKRFERGVAEECKYYGDCCQDPMRVWEQLERDTFSCQKLPSSEFNHLYFSVVSNTGF